MGKVGVNTHTRGISAGQSEGGAVSTRACMCAHLGMACVCVFKCICMYVCVCVHARVRVCVCVSVC